MQTESDAPAWTIPVSCNWGELAAQGLQLARLTNVAVFPAGSVWLRAGESLLEAHLSIQFELGNMRELFAGLKREQSVQDLQALELNAFLALENGLGSAVATCWSGNLMLLNCNHQATPPMSNLTATDTQTSQFHAHSTKLSSQLRTQSRCLSTAFDVTVATGPFCARCCSRCVFNS